MGTGTRKDSVEQYSSPNNKRAHTSIARTQVGQKRRNASKHEVSSSNILQNFAVDVHSLLGYLVERLERVWPG